MTSGLLSLMYETNVKRIYMYFTLLLSCICLLFIYFFVLFFGYFAYLLNVFTA